MLLDPRQPGRFRRAYIAVAVLVMLALIIGLLGPLVWRLVWLGFRRRWEEPYPWAGWDQEELH